MDILIDGHTLTIELVAAVAGGQTVGLAGSAIAAMEKSRAYVEQLIADKKVVYGITTGFGRFSDVVIETDDVGQLQLNLIRSHACGLGEPLSREETRALMLLRANALASGYSGVRSQLVQLLLDCLNKDVLPIVPIKGSLGASGDLVPLAHMALFLIGEGKAWGTDKEVPAQRALADAGLSPIVLAAKEGLALINGTQFMAARGVICLNKAIELADAADGIASLSCQALQGIPAAYSPLVQAVRPHPGQEKSAKNLRCFLKGSQLTTLPGELRTQDAYALRCVPQVHGASRDVLTWVAQLLTREINSATDNPLIFADEGQVISAGNFHGQPLAFAMDFLAIAMAELANISERRLERLVNPLLSDLPPFLTARGGLNSGLMIAQYVAAALVSENKILSHPASVDSIPSSGNQEDHVSMGANAANKACQVATNLQDVLAIELLAACQAVDFRGPDLLSNWGKHVYEQVRACVSFIDSDCSFQDSIKAISRLIAEGKINMKEGE